MSAVVHQEKVLRDHVEVMRLYDDAEAVGFDLETSGLKPARDKVAVVAIGATGRPPAVLHFGWRPVPEELVAWLNRRVLVGHNITAFDIPFLMRCGYDPLVGPGFADTLVAEQLALVTDRRGVSRKLQDVLKRRLDIQIDKGIEHGRWTNDELDDDQVRYAATDVSYALRLLAAQEEVFAKNGTVDAWRAELAIAPVVSNMIGQGMPLDDRRRLEHLDLAAGGMAALDDELRATLGIVSADVASPKRVREAFERELGVKLASTDEAVMQRLEQREGLPGRAAHLVLRARRFKKRFMYDERWCDEHVTRGRVHAQFWPLGTDTGRFSSKDPNLQQVPRDMRDMFGFDEADDLVLVKADYSQIEVVCAAVLSRETRLVEWATGGRDVHRMVGAQLFGVPEEEITKEQRSIAKAGSFTLLFAGGVPSLVASARDGGVELPRDEAQRIVRRFFRNFRHVEEYIAGVREKVDLYNRRGRALRVEIPGGPVRSLYGPENLRATRVVNSMVQGAAAAGMKRAIARTRRAGIAQLVRSTVHDELILECRREDAADVQDLLIECMIEGMREIIDVYVNVEASVGSHWS